MSYRVFIPCAGTGSRLGELTRYINKSLVSVSNRPVLCHIIEQFPEDVEFVVALGHKGYLIREFVSLAYPSRTFCFVEVFPFEGQGSGLGLSVRACEKYLQTPFVFTSCDTLVDELIPPPESDWVGYADVADTGEYRTLKIGSETISELFEKGGEQCAEQSKAYIGLSGIYSYKKFWAAMEQGGQTSINVGESYGLRALIPSGIKAHKFTWHDTGNLVELSKARAHYREPNQPTILDKENEAIWFLGNTVIKFCDDTDFIANRVNRARQLRDFIPPVTGFGKNMYRYTKSQGDVFSAVVNTDRFRKLLEHCEGFWERRSLDSTSLHAFHKSCMKFYRHKTIERVELFYRKFNRKDGQESINGEEMPTTRELLDSIDWDWLASGLPGRFHGDLHFENILWNENHKTFIFLDWRQDFAGDLDIGDIYYDFAKLLHGLVVNHDIVSLGLYSVSWSDSSIEYDLHRKQILVECERYFCSWLEDHGYERDKVEVISALIYLNIAALHHSPYSFLLFALGKQMLSRIGKSK